MTAITLSVLDRLLLSDILPKTGKIVEMILVASLLSKIRLTPDEITEYGLVDTPDGRITWDKDKVKEKYIELDVSEIKVLRDAIYILDKAGQITLDSLPMVKKVLAIEVSD
jgi:hypothetical protein